VGKNGCNEVTENSNVCISFLTLYPAATAVTYFPRTRQASCYQLQYQIACVTGVRLRRLPGPTWQITWDYGHGHRSHSVGVDYVYKPVGETDIPVTAGVRAGERDRSTYANQWLRPTYVCQPVYSRCE